MTKQAPAGPGLEKFAKISQRIVPDQAMVRKRKGAPIISPKWTVCLVFASIFQNSGLHKALFEVPKKESKWWVYVCMCMGPSRIFCTVKSHKHLATYARTFFTILKTIYFSSKLKNKLTGCVYMCLCAVEPFCTFRLVKSAETGHAHHMRTPFSQFELRLA